MRLYFAADKTFTDNQRAIRMALNLSGVEQKWFYNVVDVRLSVSGRGESGTKGGICNTQTCLDGKAIA